MSITDEIYIEHFGVRGMRWGVRGAQARLESAQEKADKAVAKADKAVANADKRQQGLDKAVKNERRNKILRRVGAAAIVGAAATGVILTKRGNTSIKSVPKIDPMPFKVFAKNYRIESATQEAIDITLKVINSR